MGLRNPRPVVPASWFLPRESRAISPFPSRWPARTLENASPNDPVTCPNAAPVFAVHTHTSVRKMRMHSTNPHTESAALHVPRRSRARAGGWLVQSAPHHSSSMVPLAAFLNVFLRDAVSCPNAASISRRVHTSMRDVTRATTPLRALSPALRTRARRADNGFDRSVAHRSCASAGTTSTLNPKPNTNRCGLERLTFSYSGAQFVRYCPCQRERSYSPSCYPLLHAALRFRRSGLWVGGLSRRLFKSLLFDTSPG